MDPSDGDLVRLARAGDPAAFRILVERHLPLAVAAGAPVRVADPVMDRLAVPLTGGDLLGTILEREPAAAEHELPRRAPRNLAFTNGLAGWKLFGRFLRDVSGSHWHDYSAAAEGPSATLRSAVPAPHGSACLGQQILAEDYRGRAVTFRAELRTEDVADRAWLYLQVQTEQPEHAVYDYESAPLTGRHDWASHELTAQVPPGAVIIQFGVTLRGPGQVTLRHPNFTSGLHALALLDGPSGNGSSRT